MRAPAAHSALSLLALGLVLLAPARARAEGPSDADLSRALERYVQRAQPEYGWRVTGREALPGEVELVQLELVSQVWQGIRWTHRLNLLDPAPATGARARAGHAILVIAGSGRDRQLMTILGSIAARLGVPVAILHDVPNQPLFPEADARGRGLREDALIAHTFKRFAETGDPTWPALLPMTRAAVAAMDALGEYSVAEAAAAPGERARPWAHGKLEKFVTTGGSKRGWTTWLSGVVEPRVIAIAPIVFDNLNFAAQIRLHMETWGEPSPSIHDYTDAGLLEMLETERGRQLGLLVDPYSYAARLTLPKLILIGTNDTYWPLEAIHLYRGALPGELYTHYVPNAGHSAGLSVVQALVGFFDHVTDRTPDLPQLELTVAPRLGAEIRAARATDTARLGNVRLWATWIEGRDFTKATWVSVDAARAGDAWRAPFPAAVQQDHGRAAFIGEVELPESSGATFLLHTPVQVWELGPTR